MQQVPFELLEEILKSSQKNTIIILSLVNILVGLVITFYLEKYKQKNNEKLAILTDKLSTISKKTEIKFKDHIESQIKAIKILYEKYVNLEYATKALLKEEFINHPHDDLKSRIINWYNYMKDFHIFYNRNRIVFTDKIKMKIGNQLFFLEKINNYLNQKKTNLIELEDMFNSDYQYMYEYSEKEEAEIINQIRNIKENPDFLHINQTFKAQKKLLEKEYKKIIQ